MGKQGKLTPAQWGAFMPAHDSLSHKGPWYYRDTECFVAEYVTDEEAALAQLPSDLELYEPATGFMVIETNHWTTLGPYSEVYNGVLCTYEGELYAYVPGVYVTGECSQIVGREVWGFGKKRADRIGLTTHSNGRVEVFMDVDPGDGAIRGSVYPQENLPADAMASMPLICLRIVPDAEGGDVPALAQLVVASFTAEPIVGSDGRAEVYSGPGHLEFGCPSAVDLPVQDVLGFKYARFNAVLPYGRVLKTYSLEEIEGTTKRPRRRAKAA